MPKRRHATARSRVTRDVVFVDSSAWIALFSARDQHHDEIDRAFHDAAGHRVRLVTTSLVISEVHRFQLFRAGITAAARALDAIDGSRLVRVVFPGADHHAGARQWIAKFADQPISYVDAVSFAFMHAEGLRAALTLDRDFVIAGFELWQGAR